MRASSGTSAARHGTAAATRNPCPCLPSSPFQPAPFELAPLPGPTRGAAAAQLVPVNGQREGVERPRVWVGSHLRRGTQQAMRDIGAETHSASPLVGGRSCCTLRGSALTRPGTQQPNSPIANPHAPTPCATTMRHTMHTVMTLLPAAQPLTHQPPTPQPPTHAPHPLLQLPYHCPPLPRHSCVYRPAASPPRTTSMWQPTKLIMPPSCSPGYCGGGVQAGGAACEAAV